MKQRVGLMMGLASLVAAISVSAQAFLINNTPLDLAAEDLGSQIVAPLVRPFSVYDIGTVPAQKLPK